MGEIQVVADSWLEIIFLGVLGLVAIVLLRVLPRHYKVTLIKEKGKEKDDDAVE